jgi:hypothetical protein
MQSHPYNVIVILSNAYLIKLKLKLAIQQPMYDSV